MKYDILDELTTAGAKVEVLAYDNLSGSTDARAAENLFFLRQAGVRPKTVRLTMNKGKARLEPGALYHMQGDLEFRASSGGGIGRAFMRKTFSGETFFINELVGSGTVYLEPDWGHFILVEITPDTPGLIVEKSAFYGGVGEIDVSTRIVPNTAGIVGGEGLWQTRVTGQGIAILTCPVPWDEVAVCDVSEGKVSVDGPFAIMRTDDVDYRVEKSSKSWLATSVSGEGILQTFSGTGQVWIAPSLAIYDGLKVPMTTLGAARSDRSG